MLTFCGMHEQLARGLSLEGGDLAGLRLHIALPGIALLICGYWPLPHDPLTHQRCVAADLPRVPGRAANVGAGRLGPRHNAVARPAAPAQGELVVAQPVPDPPRARAQHRPSFSLPPSPSHRGKVLLPRRAEPLEGRLLLDALLVAWDQVGLGGRGRLERDVGSPVASRPAPVLQAHHKDDAHRHEGKAGDHPYEDPEGRGDGDTRLGPAGVGHDQLRQRLLRADGERM